MASNRSRRVFISYRRADAIGHARALEQAFNCRVGRDHVFFDVADIATGAQFPRRIEEELAASTDVIVVIGRQWAGVDERTGRRRLDDPDDWVRRELALALAPGSGKRVWVALFDGAKPPEKGDLPQDIQALADINAETIHLDQYLEDITNFRDRVAPPEPPSRRAALALLAGLAVVPTLVLLGQLHVFDRLDTRLESLMAGLAVPSHGLPAGDRIVLIAIDAASRQRLGLDPDRPERWRPHHARLVRTLAAGGARLIVFDLRFDAASEADGPLREALRTAAVPVVAAASAFTAKGEPITDAGFRDAIAAWGHACLGLRLLALPEVNLVLGRPSGAVRSLALAAALTLAEPESPWRIGDEHQLRILASPRGAHTDYPAGPPFESAQMENCPAQQLHDTPYVLRFDVAPAGHWRKPEARMAYAAALEAEPDTLAQFVRDKIVIVGVDDSPAEQFGVRQGGSRTERTGFELQADALRAVLATRSLQDVPRAVGLAWQMLLMIGAGVLGVWLGLAWRTAGRPRALAAWLSLMAGLGGYAFTATVIYRYHHLVLPLVYPALAASLALAATHRVFHREDCA